MLSKVCYRFIRACTEYKRFLNDIIKIRIEGTDLIKIVEVSEM